MSMSLTVIASSALLHDRYASDTEFVGRRDEKVIASLKIFFCAI